MNCPPEDIDCLIVYARRKYTEERWPLSEALRAVRHVLAKLEPPREPMPAPKPYVPSTVMSRKRR